MKNLSIRPITSEDYHFILSSWLKSNYAGMMGWRPDRQTYFNIHQSLIKQVLDEEGTLVACPSDDESLIVGWVNFSDHFLNYLFIKQTFEGLGIASALLAQTGLDPKNLTVTHYTKWFHDRFGKYEPKYNPYLFKQGVSYENQMR